MIHSSGDLGHKQIDVASREEQEIRDPSSVPARIRV